MKLDSQFSKLVLTYNHASKNLDTACTYMYMCEFGPFKTDLGATSEYPTTHALLKSTATMVHHGPQSASKVICMY